MFSANASQVSNDTLYVEDVFSTYLYTGNGSTQTINNGIQLGDGPADGTVLQLPGDNTSDVAPVANTLTVSNVTVNTSNKVYGTGSLNFNGTTSRIQVSSDKSRFAFGTGDFTVEGWFYQTASNTYPSVFEIGNHLGANAILFIKYANGAAIYSGAFYGSATTALNTWQHIAWVRRNGVLTIYVNGVGNTPVAFTNNITDISTVSVGAERTLDSTYTYTGQIDDFRVSNTAKYTANFTPPAAPLPLDTLVVGKGGLVWSKSRSNIYNHSLIDTVRGGSSGLASNSSGQAGTDTALLSFSNGGYSVLGAFPSLNISGTTYASWAFREAPTFFDVLTYTGNGVSGRRIAHSLGSTPGMIVVKAVTDPSPAVGDWAVRHKAIASKVMFLNLTNAATNDSNTYFSGSPTATDFGVGAAHVVNKSGVTYVAYLFADVTTTDGVIRCGSYEGNGSSTGPTITLGWEPQWLLIKNTNGADNWQVFDNMRGMPVGAGDPALAPNTDAAEISLNLIDPTATGFQLVSSNSLVNGSGSTYIYIAIRRGPMRTPTSGASVFSPGTYTGNNAASRTFTPNFPMDMVWTSSRTDPDGFGATRAFGTRLQGTNNWLRPFGSFVEDSISSWSSTNTDYTINGSNNRYFNADYMGGYVNHFFRRAPGFFDVVCYTGTGSGRTVNHNLTVAPELVIVKNRTSAFAWFVWHSAIAITQTLILNGDGGPATQGALTYWNNTAPTATAFSVGSNDGTNSTGTQLVAYLFASCPGVSKVGSYTGNGATPAGGGQTINCGFAAGARFILIKRTDSEGNWWLWDSARGIVAANDPALALNLTSSEVTSVDAVDPTNVGFIVNQTATVNINVNGGTYIFWAVA